MFLKPVSGIAVCLKYEQANVSFTETLFTATKKAKKLHDKLTAKQYA
jgi:hypothetical protein